jgi:topoisomerase-4 subunit A
VIAVIRAEDDPKPVMMKKWKLTDLQADAVLNMRLRALRKLEEIEIRQERDKLKAEQVDLKGLLEDQERQWKSIAAEIADLRRRFGADTPLGRRRTELGEAPSAIVIPLEAVVDREPVTIVCSDKGWIRALKGHVQESDDVRYKEGDRGRFFLHAETTDKLLVFGTNGRFYTIGADKLPGGRGHGEPIRLMIDLGNDQDIVALLVHAPGRKLVVASHDGRGFVVPEEDVVAQTRSGKQVLNVAAGVEAQACAPVAGDHVAVIGQNRKMIIFPVTDLPEMSRGRGVILQKYRDGGLSDVKTFNLGDGLSWRLGDKIRTETALQDWLGRRAQAGRLPPRGFPSSNKFG